LAKLKCLEPKWLRNHGIPSGTRGPVDPWTRGPVGAKILESENANGSLCHEMALELVCGADVWYNRHCRTSPVVLERFWGQVWPNIDREPTQQIPARLPSQSMHTRFTAEGCATPSPECLAWRPDGHTTQRRSMGGTRHPRTSPKPYVAARWMAVRF
jgi:hypothetical protein